MKTGRWPHTPISVSLIFRPSLSAPPRSLIYSDCLYAWEFSIPN